MRGKMQEEIIFLMSIVIGKENFSNKECKVLHMHVGFVLLWIIRKEMCLVLKKLQRVIRWKGKQCQSDELAPNGTFRNIVH